MTKSLPLPIRFGHRHKRILYAVFLLLWTSGALWLAFHYFLRVPGEFGEVAHPLEKWWLRLHGLTAFAMLVAIGSVLPIHARRAWHLKKNRASGATMKGTFLWMALTGYALYYFADDANEAWLPLLHWVAGLSIPLVLIVHVRLGRARPQVVPRPAATEVESTNMQPKSGSPESAPEVSPYVQTRTAGRDGRAVA